MRIALKPIDQQVIVITGGSSGIGLVTAKRAARRGARVVIAARNGRELQRAVWTIEAEGGEAVSCVADVAESGDVERVADMALDSYGRIDTWVNNAGVALYGKVTEIPLADQRRQFDVVYWGTVYGSLAAIPHLALAGGALINVSSIVADRAVPMQGSYSAAKHAVKGFTDALRMELARDGLPISVTLVKPSSVATPLFEKAVSYTGVELEAIPPVYAPELVADAILTAAQRPVRSVTIGVGGAPLNLGDVLAPGVTDRLMQRTLARLQAGEREAEPGEGNLWRPTASDGGERGMRHRGRIHRRSAWTTAQLHPGGTALALGGVVGLVLGARALARAKR